MATSPDPTREQLRAFLAGALSEAEQDDLCAHVERCPRCQAVLEELVVSEEGAEWSSWRRCGRDPGPGGSFLGHLMNSEPPAGWSAPGWNSAEAAEGVSAPEERRGRKRAPVIPGYEVRGELGRGGMGVVYLARQIRLNRPCALKLIPAAEHAGPAAVARFLAEAAVVARLRHPNVVQVYGAGDHDGYPYLELEYVEGGSLAQALDGAPWSPRRAAALVEGLARAMAEAHRLRVVHRDLKPANVLLAADGAPKVTDFGLAKSLGDSSLTRPGAILGTPGYMAPEQAEGGTGHVGPSADVYALGAILYELLTGRPPFRGETVLETLQHVRSAEPAPPSRLVPGMPRAVETVCLKCLEKDPQRRYAGATELADDLARFLAGEPIRARPQTPLERLVRWARNHGGIAASLAMILLLLLVLSAGSLLAAVHFRRMEGEQRRLALRNGALARENEAERRRAEQARDQARASQRIAELTLADMDTEHGLQADAFGRGREAVLWFAKAAQVAASDPERRSANLIRARAWSRHVSRPVAVLPHPSGVPLTLTIHPAGGHLLSTPAPYSGTTAVWVLSAERPLELPGGAETTTAAWSPDGGRLAVGDRGGVTLYRFPDLTGPHRIPTDGTPTLLRFGPGGDRLAVATGPVVRVWDRRRGRFMSPRLEHPALVLTLGFTPDGDRLVSAAEDGRFRVFALGAGGAEPELTGRHQQFEERWTLHAPRADRTGTRLVTVTAPSELTWWDLAAPRRLESLTFQGGRICHVEPSPDGSLLAVTVENLGVSVLNVATRETVARLKSGQGGMLFSAFHPSGRSLVVAGAHPEAQQWGLPEGRWLGAPALEATGFRAAAFSEDGRLLATAGYENQIRVWALPRPDPREFAVPTDQVVGRGTFSADSRLLLARLRGKSVRVYRVADGSPAGPPLRPDGELAEAAFSPDVRSVVTASTAPGSGGLVDLWDWSTGLRRYPTRTTPGPPLALGVSASGRVAVLCRDGLLLLLDASTGRAVREWSIGPTNAPPEDVGVSLSGDGRTVLVNCDHHIWVWDSDKCGPRFDPPCHQGLLYAALSADGRLIASAGVDSGLRVWSAETGAQLGPPMVHPSWVDGGVDFHPDSRHVLTICKDMALRVWDVTTGRLAAPPIQPASIGPARFSPDGRVIVSAGGDGTVEVWDWRAGRRLLPSRRLPLETDWAFTGNRTVQISPDGRHVAVGGRPGLPVLGLDDLDPTAAEPSQNLIRWAELISHHRVGEGGTVIHLTGEEWLRLWRDLHRAADFGLPGTPGAATGPEGHLRFSSSQKP
jgi:WD40 repeat protein